MNETRDCLFLCQPQLLITMMIEGRSDCTSSDEKDIVFDALQKRYGRGCVRHHCQKLCIIHQISSWNIRQLGDIRRTVEDLHRKSSSGPIYSIRVDGNNENVMFLCQEHLNIIIMSEMRYDLHFYFHQ